MLNIEIENVIKLLLILLAVYIACMVFFTKGDAHPDEFVAKPAIEYYNDNWLIPDIRNLPKEEFNHLYGITRLSELNLYYIFAGKIDKIGKLLNIDKSYRLFNMIIAFLMIFIIYKNFKENPWLLLVLGLTPQVWYIFSYATSDAFDYFLSFLIIYQLTVQSSFLNQIYKLQEFVVNKEVIIKLSIMGILLGMLLMGKPNFYVVHILVAYILIYRYIQLSDKRQRIIFIKYTILLALISTLVFLVRYSEVIYHYGFNKKAVVLEMKDKYANPAYKPSTPLKEKRYGFNLRDRGMSLNDFLFKIPFIEYSLKGVVGVYGYYTIFSTKTYYIMMYVLYIIMILYVLYTIIKSREYNKLINILILFGIIGISFILSIYHSWNNELQPQGRYLLPAIFSVVFIFASSIDKAKYVNILLLLLLTYFMSTYSFIEYGILKTL